MAFDHEPGASRVLVLDRIAIGILRRVSPIPERTIAGIRGDVEWLGKRVHESL